MIFASFKYSTLLSLACCTAIFAGRAPRAIAAGKVPSAPPPQVDWGQIVSHTNGDGLVTLEVRSWPVNGRLDLPTPFPHITAAHLADGRQSVPLKWVFNADATQLHLEAPGQPPANLPATILLETAEHS